MKRHTRYVLCILVAVNLLSVYQESAIEMVFSGSLGNEPSGIPPIADIGPDVSIWEGDSVSLDASGSYDPDGEIVRFHYQFGDGESFTYEPMLTNNRNILVYSTADTAQDNYLSKVFDDDLPRILTDYGYNVTITDRYRNHTIDTSLLDGVGQLWIINGDYDLQGDLSTTEVQTILEFAENGHGLFIIADHGGMTYEAIHDVNQIATKLGVRYWGMIDQGPQGAPIAPQLQSHPIFKDVQTLCGHTSSAYLDVTDPSGVQVVAEYRGESMIAVRNDTKGRIVFDNTLVRYFDEGTEIPSMHWILVGDTPQFVKNVADWLSWSDVSGPIPVTHRYGDDGHGSDGIYTVTLTVTDNEGLIGTDTKVVTVRNVDPVVSISGPSFVNEGALLTITTYASDPGSDDLTFSFDWGDGTPTTTLISFNDALVGDDPYPSPQGDPRQVSISASHHYGDNGNFVITVTVMDDDGGQVSTETEIEVGNLPPSLSVLLSGDVNEGRDATLTLHASDPGSDDITFDVQWGDGRTEQETFFNDGIGPDLPQSPLGTSPFSVQYSQSHKYGDDAYLEIIITASDDDGGKITRTVGINVTNMIPSISGLHSLVVDENSPALLVATSTDPGSDDLLFEWSWEYGPTRRVTYYNNGITPDPYPSPGGVYPFTVVDMDSYTYGDDGNFDIILTVHDDDGGSASLATQVVVNNVDPIVVLDNYTIHVNKPRTMGYWRHQCDVLLHYGDHTGILPRWVEEISSKSYVFAWISSSEDICEKVMEGDAQNMLVMAQQQLMALWLNIVSGKILPTTPLEFPSLGFFGTLEEAMYEIENVLLQSNERGELERVKDITDYVNNGVGIGLAYLSIFASGADPGSDDLTFSWDLGDGSPVVSRTYYNNFPTNSPDPYPSPEVNPIQATDSVSHWYMVGGTYVVNLFLEDDDGGFVSLEIVIEI